MIHAGTQPNSVPATCHLTLDRRLLPGETPERELEVLRERLAHIPGVEITLRPLYFFPGEVDPDSEIVDVVRASSVQVTGRAPEIVGAPYATDCSVFVQRGIPAVVFGPGNPAECHCVNERLAVHELREGSLILAQATLDFLAA
jgi:acetylornithine deacetylase/succinyl-diaminopimelate desuccinylase-like protein